MSSRALRRLRREQEQQQQQQQLDKGSTQDEESSDEEEVVKPKAPNTFDMLTEDVDSEDATSETAQSSEIDHLPTEAKQNKNVSISPANAKSKGKSRNKKNKRKKPVQSGSGKPATEGENETSDLDEIDLALKSLSTKDRDGTYAFTKPKPDDGYEETYRLLGVESKHLNALNEMKRLFGNVVLESDENPGVPGRRRGRGQQNLDLGGALAAQNSRASRGQGLAGLALRRNVFMLGKEEWPKATSGGLGMEVEEQKDGVTWYRFVHNTGYQDVQRQFQTCVESMDPQRMIQLLQFNPYHISTLLQVSEIAKQQGDHSVSGDLLERALFSFGRSVHSSFVTALSEGKARLNFRRRENREFWLAVWRYINSLGQRGTWRTAYEWAKLLLSLQPETDPYCVRLLLDQLAIRGGQMEHFLKLRASPMYHIVWHDHPNIQISSALAEYKLKYVEACRASLLAAIHAYPWIFARLFRELNIEHLPKSIWGKEAHSEREKFECELYICYAKDLWNSPDTISFLVEVSESAESSHGVRMRSDISLNEARHVLLSGTPALMSLIPRVYTTMSTSASDPLPPPDVLLSYSTDPPERRRYLPQDFLDPPPNIPQGNAVAGSVEVQDEEQELQGLQGFFSRLIPWFGQSEAPVESTGQEASQETLNRAANESGLPREIVAERGARLLELLRRVLGRQQQEQQALEAQARQGPRPSDADGDLQIPEEILLGLRAEMLADEGSDLLPLPDPSGERNSEDELAQDDEVYDDQRNQRWLAGQGLAQLREAAAAHGTDESSWSDVNSGDARAHLEEYAKRVLQLEQPRSRNFILDYALPQGTSKEVKAMVLRAVESQRARGGS